MKQTRDESEKNSSSATRPVKKSTTTFHIFAADPSKAYYEKFSLIWAPTSMFLLLIGVFGTGIYKQCDRNSYLIIATVGCLPGLIIPLIFPCEADRKKPLSQRFWLKATLWIMIFGFYGNYFWTHYFYSILGAEYLFDAHRFNDVPLVTFLATFFYFTFYFNFANLYLRCVRYYISTLPTFLNTFIWWCSIFILSFGTAVFEAVSIQHFPLYTYKDRLLFLTIGSAFYGIYFVIGFPMFFNIDEDYDAHSSANPPRKSVWETCVNSFAATSIVLLLLDLWRLNIGSIYDVGKHLGSKVPFIFQQANPISSNQHVDL